MFHAREHRNIAKKFFTNLNEFRSCGKYTDVLIECEGNEPRHFQCHRLVLAAGSKYFDNIFSQNSVILQPIVLSINATIFAQILKFLYTEHILITKDNIVSLVLACDYLAMSDLEDICLGFISRNIKHINILGLYVFACAKRKLGLLKLLGRCDMTHELEKYFFSKGHCQLPVDVFGMILERYKSSSQDAINHWIRHSSDTRQQHFNDLVERHEKFISSIRTSLYVYVEHEDSVSGRKNFTINTSPTTKCTFARDLFLPRCTSIIAPIVGNDSQIYYFLAHKEGVNFVTCTSVDLYPVTILTSHEAVFSYYHPELKLCYIPNSGIYMYSGNLCMNLYNTRMNSWSVTPQVKKIIPKFCMTALNDMVYLIDVGTKTDVATGSYVQSYDHRTRTWLEMPRTNYKYCSGGGVCCVLDDKIYMCGGEESGKNAERYDSVAAKWEIIGSANKKVDVYSILAPYNNKLWTFNHAYIPDYNDDNLLCIDIYDPQSNTWSVSQMLKEEWTRTGEAENGVVIASLVYTSF